MIILASLWLRLNMSRHDYYRSFDTNALALASSLALTSISNSKNPSIRTYSIPLNIDVNSNHWDLMLRDNGRRAKGYDFTRQTNGTYLVEWNTLFTIPGIHVLQVELDRPIRNTVLGSAITENVTNLVTFDTADTSFVSLAFISGTLHVSSADYKIDIYDTTNNLLKTITNHTDKGAIDEIWDLKAVDGQVREDTEFDAKVYIWPTSANTNKPMTPKAVSNPGPYPYYLFRYGG
jgi:hypothetical protein